jgi:hypothetical protein
VDEHEPLMTASTKKYAHRASIGHDGRVMVGALFCRGIQLTHNNNTRNMTAGRNRTIYLYMVSNLTQSLKAPRFNLEPIKSRTGFKICFQIQQLVLFNASCRYVLEDRARGVQTAVGRPKVKSIFHAMAGQRKFGEDGSEMHPKLVAVDVDAYGEEWTFVERRNVVIYACLQVVAWFVLAVADKDSWLRYQMDGKGGDNSEPRLIDWHFWCKLLANQGIFWAVFACCGLAVVTQDWNEVGPGGLNASIFLRLLIPVICTFCFGTNMLVVVVFRRCDEGYSRKVCHVVMYLTPFLMAGLITIHTDALVLSSLLYSVYRLTCCRRH